MLFLPILVTALTTVSAASHGSHRRGASSRKTSSKGVSRASTPPQCDHPDWQYLNGYRWYKLDPTGQDHARLHSYLSMSAYGNYRKTCPATFPKGYTVLEDFSTKLGQAGYTVQVPDMNKIVVVFRGTGDSVIDKIDWTPYSIEKLVPKCKGCTVAKGIYDLYMSAKQATNDWAVAKAAVTRTKLLFSVTGHGLGGCVAALAGLDLGARNLVHYAHNQGTPRCFNYPAVQLYDNLFQVWAGQSLVNTNDFAVQIRPLSNDYYHLGQKVHITGPKTQWFTPCWGCNENATCLGNGSSAQDHQYYFTPLGSCGAADKGF